METFAKSKVVLPFSLSKLKDSLKQRACSLQGHLIAVFVIYFSSLFTLIHVSYVFFYFCLLKISLGIMLWHRMTQLFVAPVLFYCL